MWTGLVIVAVVLTVSGRVWAQGPPRSEVTPEQALARLKDGNARFVSGRPRHPHSDAPRLRETSAHGQRPFAAILGCSDSRAPVEILFDQGIGDVFVVRVPGNVCNADEIAGVEYAVEHLGVPLCVVLGHTQCGAVTGVVSGAEMHGHLKELVHNIRMAADQALSNDPDLEGEALVEATVRANVWQSITDLMAGSAALRDRYERYDLDVVGAIYDLATGRVEWLKTGE